MDQSVNCTRYPSPVPMRRASQAGAPASPATAARNKGATRSRRSASGNRLAGPPQLITNTPSPVTEVNGTAAAWIPDCHSPMAKQQPDSPSSARARSMAAAAGAASPRRASASAQAAPGRLARRGPWRCPGSRGSRPAGEGRGRRIRGWPRRRSWRRRRRRPAPPRRPWRGPVRSWTPWPAPAPPARPAGRNPGPAPRSRANTCRYRGDSADSPARSACR